MGIATSPLLPSVKISHPKGQQNCLNHSMSQDHHLHHQGIFSFSNGFERLQQELHQQQQQHHIAQQIRRDKLRVQGFDPPPPLVAIEEVESSGLPGGYETAGMLSEMFNFPPAAGAATDISMDVHSYRHTRPPPPAAVGSSEWYTAGNSRQGMVVGGLGPLDESKDHENIDGSSDHHHRHHPQQISGINAESATAMQLFLMNPQPARSPSPSPSHPPPPSTLHMLLPNQSNLIHHPVNTASPAPPGTHGAPFGPPQFTWVPDSGNEASTANPSELGGIHVEGQGLSLSLSSSLQHLEAAKAEELRMGDAGSMLFFNQGGPASGTTATNSGNYPYKNHHHQALHIQGGVGVGQNHQVHIGFGSSSLGVVNVLRNSKYAKAAQELLEEFCSVGRGQLRKNKFGGGKQNTNNPTSNPSPSGGAASAGAANSSSSSKDLPPLSAADRLEHQRRKVKLLSMLDEVDRRYNHYCGQMQMVVNSFDLVMGFGAAVPYTALAQKAMSRHFRCLKDAIAAQLKSSCELLGEKDAGTSGVTKGETPRLKLLEQSLRQQRAFHQMGMMEQEAWRPQRGLPERSVNILRAWLFEHFLHPYPSDADKHLLARQTGLSRNQVSNWFINARVRLWKPMVEEMYQQEAKDEAEDEEREMSQSDNNNINNIAQTSTPNTTTATTTSTTATAATTVTATTPAAIAATAKRSEINDPENDPSLIAINRQCFSENQAKHPSNITTTSTSLLPISTVTPPQSFPALIDSDACRRSGVVGATSGTAADVGSTLIRFGTSSGDVSLTLGLRHAGNLPEKSSFSLRDFGGC